MWANSLYSLATEKSWFDAQPDEFCKYFLDYIKEDGFCLFFFTTWVQVWNKVPPKKHPIITFLPKKHWYFKS